MQELFLAGRILPAGARLVVRHVFCSEEPRPLEVVYCFALPRDAALRRFRITGAGFSVHSRLEPVGEARRAYEEAIEKGHLTSVAREYKDGLINLTVGNVRPGESVQVYLEILAGVEARDDGFRFRFPFTLAPPTTRKPGPPKGRSSCRRRSSATSCSPAGSRTRRGCIG
jgi:Ca-activated chloride channel family protein